MHKVTLIIFLASLTGCSESDPNELIVFEQELNRRTEASIDSAYRIMNAHCDSLVEMNAVKMLDSINAIKKTNRK